MKGEEIGKGTTSEEIKSDGETERKERKGENRKVELLC